MLDIEKIEQASDCIAGYDYSLRIVLWNNSLAKKYGISKEYALGKHVLELFPHVKGDYRLRSLQQSIEEDQVYFFPSLPYVFEPGLYSQLVIPETLNGQAIVLSVVRDHVADEYFSKTDLLGPLLAAPLTA
jgi:PAS domain-containing protein